MQADGIRRRMACGEEKTPGGPRFHPCVHRSCGSHGRPAARPGRPEIDEKRSGIPRGSASEQAFRRSPAPAFQCATSRIFSSPARSNLRRALSSPLPQTHRRRGSSPSALVLQLPSPAGRVAGRRLFQASTTLFRASRSRPEGYCSGIPPLSKTKLTAFLINSALGRASALRIPLCAEIASDLPEFCARLTRVYIRGIGCEIALAGASVAAGVPKHTLVRPKFLRVAGWAKVLGAWRANCSNPQTELAGRRLRS